MPEFANARNQHLRQKIATCLNSQWREAYMKVNTQSSCVTPPTPTLHLIYNCRASIKSRRIICVGHNYDYGCMSSQEIMLWVIVFDGKTSVHDSK